MKRKKNGSTINPDRQNGIVPIKILPKRMTGKKKENRSKSKIIKMYKGLRPVNAEERYIP